MQKLIIIFALLAASAWGAYRLGLFALFTRKAPGAEEKPEQNGESTFNVDDLIVGKRYGNCPELPAGDTAEKAEPTPENPVTFAGQDVRGDEPETTQNRILPDGPREQIPDTNGTDSKQQPPVFNYELILVDADPGLDDFPQEETRRVPPSRPAIPITDTGKILDELIWDDDQPEFETDASESEREQMDSFTMEDFQ